MNILITELSETHPAALELLEKNHHRVVTDLQQIIATDIKALLIRTYTRADADYLSQFPNLKYVLRIGVGLDNIDVQECKRRGIQVINAPGSNANAVAEYVIGVMIMLLRRIPQQSSKLRSQEWRDKKFIGEELTGKTLGLIGCGAIGRLLAAKLKALGVGTILGYDPYLSSDQLKVSNIQKSELDDVLQNADLISLHLPLTADTKNLINGSKLKLMKKNAILVNSSRGGIVQEQDLIHALQKNTIAGAALDVFEHEPRVKKELIQLTNLIATPHIAGYTLEADEEMACMPVRLFLEKIKNH